jgi:hypothetical protein
MIKKLKTVFFFEDGLDLPRRKFIKDAASLAALVVVSRVVNVASGSNDTLTQADIIAMQLSLDRANVPPSMRWVK